jgi:hypothetical protein
MVDEIRKHAEAIHGDIVTIRRHLHKHPELSFQEYETAAFVKSQLDLLGIRWRAVANTGILAEITGELMSRMTCRMLPFIRISCTPVATISIPPPFWVRLVYSLR